MENSNWKFLEYMQALFNEGRLADGYKNLDLFECVMQDLKMAANKAEKLSPHQEEGNG